MPVGELTQLVVFRTPLPADRFVTSWRPVASGFLAAGLGTITLAGFDDVTEDGIAFVSRNTWPENAYRRAFPGGLAADGAGGPVSVTQAGVFSVDPASGEPVARARPDSDLTLALLRLAEPADPDAAVSAALEAVPADPSPHVVVYRGAHRGQRYDVAVTVHGPRGSGVATAAALKAAASASPAVAHGLVLSGRELLSLPS